MVNGKFVLDETLILAYDITGDKTTGNQIRGNL